MTSSESDAIRALASSEERKSKSDVSHLILPPSGYKDPESQKTPSIQATPNRDVTPPAATKLEPPNHCSDYRVCDPAGEGEALSKFDLPLSPYDPNKPDFHFEASPSNAPLRHNFEHPLVYPHPWIYSPTLTPEERLSLLSYIRAFLRHHGNTHFFNQDGEVERRKTTLPIEETSLGNDNEEVPKPSASIANGNLLSRPPFPINEIRPVGVNGVRNSARARDDDVNTSRSHDERCLKRLRTSYEDLSPFVKSDDIGHASRHERTTCTSTNRRCAPARCTLNINKK